MKARKHILVLCLLSISLLFTSCHKEGAGGKASITGSVKHHSVVIPNAVVYIKYGATEFPGTTLSDYDDQVTADANGHYEFSSLYKGNYYLYGVGYDPSYGLVTGGISVDLNKNRSYSVDVPVTE
jgi:hypothetical protein